MFFDGEMHSEGFGPGFVLVIIVPILFFCCMVRIGICRWFVHFQVVQKVCRLQAITEKG